MCDKNLLRDYNFRELGEIYIEAYRDYVTSENEGFGLGLGEMSKKTEELERKKTRLEIITKEFSSREFDERLKVYRVFSAGVVDFEDDGDYETAAEFEELCEEFYRRILD